MRRQTFVRRWAAQRKQRAERTRAINNWEAGGRRENLAAWRQRRQQQPEAAVSGSGRDVLAQLRVRKEQQHPIKPSQQRGTQARRRTHECEEPIRRLCVSLLASFIKHKRKKLHLSLRSASDLHVEAQRFTMLALKHLRFSSRRNRCPLMRQQQTSTDQSIHGSICPRIHDKNSRLLHKSDMVLLLRN